MTIFALVDCNNFYVSCERVFNPALEKKAVCVLSNNDGCIVSRSQEAKALGIPMGAPYFKYKDILEENKGIALSSNYTFYGSMSDRLMASLKHFCPEIEVYSIDEAFLQLESFSDLDLTQYCVDIRDKVKQWTGLPVSIGIGPTKTLAKIANMIAKKHPRIGVYSLIGNNTTDEILENLKLNDIWGISRGWSDRLNDLGIYNAKQLRDANPQFIRQALSVVVEKMVYELRGISCLPLDTMFSPKKNIICSRSFGKPVTSLSDLEEAISYYAANACEKLRKQNSTAQGIYVFIKTSPYGKQPYYKKGITQYFSSPLNDTRIVSRLAKQCLKKIYLPELRYNKAGVMLLDLLPESHHQVDLFDKPATPESQKLMKLMDSINYKTGKNTLFFAAEGTQKNWQMKRQKSSPCYTTRWEDLLKVKA